MSVPNTGCTFCLWTYINILSFPLVLWRGKSSNQQLRDNQTDWSKHLLCLGGAALTSLFLLSYLHFTLGEGIYFIKNISFTWRSCQPTEWKEKKLRVFFVCQTISLVKKMLFFLMGQRRKKWAWSFPWWVSTAFLLPWRTSLWCSRQVYSSKINFALKILNLLFKNLFQRYSEPLIWKFFLTIALNLLALILHFYG